MSKGSYRAALIKAGFRTKEARAKYWEVYRSRHHGEAPDKAKDNDLWKKGVNSVAWIPEDLAWDFMSQPH